MALTVLAKVGEIHPESVVATTITAYAISSILTGAVFLLMGYCKLGSLIGFFPRHILIGCIGGVGWFLVATGVEVSARLDGNLEYNLNTLQKLFQSDTVALWTIPLALAIVLRIIKRWVKLTTLDSIFYISIIAIFHCLVAAIPDLTLTQLRSKGWVFEAPQAGVPFYHFYTLYSKNSQWPKAPLYPIDHSRFPRCRLGSSGLHNTCYVCFDIFRSITCAHQHSGIGCDHRRR